MFELGMPSSIDTNRVYDCMVIGGGPAGITAGIYASRYGLSTVLITEDLGGQISLADIVENYPGFPEGVSGSDLSARFAEHLKRYDVPVLYDRVTHLGTITECTYYNIPCVFEAQTLGGETVKARTVIVATGASPRKLNVPGEAEFTGKGVSYCATCDGHFFVGKTVLTVGGGDTALQETLYLKKIGVRPIIVHRRNEFRAQRYLQRRVEAEGIERIMNHVVVEIRGDDRVRSVVLENVSTHERREIEVDGVFVFIGVSPNTSFLADMGVLDQRGYVVVDREMKTSVQGLFAAGDVTGGLRQVSAAVGEGAMAATSAHLYLENMDRQIMP